MAEPVTAPPRRRGRRWAAAAGLLLGLATVGIAGAVYKIHRDNEVITITTDDSDLEVVMKRNGELVRIVDTKTKQAWELDTGKWRLKPDGSELTIDLPENEQLKIRRNGDVVVTIQSKPKTDPKKPIPRAEDVGALPQLREGEPRIYRANARLGPALAISSDGRFAFAGTAIYGPSHVNCWDLQTGLLVRKLAEHENLIHAVSLSPDGTQLLTGAFDRSVRLWDIATGKELKRFDITVHPWVLRVAFTPDGKHVLATTNNLWLLDLATGQDLKRFDIDRGGIYDHVQAMDVSPDGTQVASGDHKGNVRLWDLKTGKSLHPFAGHLGGTFVYQVAFSPDGKTLLSAGTDKTARLWNVATGEERVRFRHERRVYTAAISPGGRYVGTAGEDQIVRVWSTATGEEIHRFAGHADPIWAMAFTPDGKHVLSTSEDKTLRMWRLPDQFVDPKRK